MKFDHKKEQLILHVRKEQFNLINEPYLQGVFECWRQTITADFPYKSFTCEVKFHM